MLKFNMHISAQLRQGDFISPPEGMHSDSETIIHRLLPSVDNLFPK